MSTTLSSASISAPPRSGPLARLWAHIWASLSPQTDAEAAVVADQLRLSRGTSQLTDAVLPLIALLVAFACRAWVATPILVLWAGTIALICAGLWIAAHFCAPQMQEGAENVRRLARIRTAMTALFMLAWCSMCVLLWIPGQAVNHMFVVLVLAASLAGAAAMLAAHPASVCVALAIHAIALMRPALTGEPLDLTLTGLGGLFWLLMAGQAYIIYKMAKRARDLEFERHAMMRDLVRAKVESDRDRAIAIEAGRTKSQFLSHMNHELRTPMNAILGFSELIKAKAFGDDSDRYSEYGGIIHESGEHLLTLINDMFDLAKIEGGRLTLQISEVPIGQLIREVVECEQAKAAEVQLNLSTELAPRLPMVLADPRAIRQIVANLLSNALKFTPAGGRVAVSAAVLDDGRVAIAVEDNGIGIAPEDQLQVFERFGRGRHDVAIADKGTGLGLAIVKGFAEAHDGEVALESAPGVGTRVTVYLPAERVQRAVAADTRKAG